MSSVPNKAESVPNKAESHLTKAPEGAGSRVWVSLPAVFLTRGDGRLLGGVLLPKFGPRGDSALISEEAGI